MRICKNCGTSFSNNSKVCTQCGCILKNYDIDAALSKDDKTVIIKSDFKKMWFFSMLGGIIYALPVIIIINFIVGMSVGLVFVTVFGGLMHLALVFLEKKFAKTSLLISKTKTIVIEGGASVDGSGGWLFITNEGVEYYTHRLNFDNKSFTLKHNEIQAIKKDGKKLVIISNNVKRTLKVNNIDAWLTRINCI